MQPTVQSDYVAANDARTHSPAYVDGLKRALRSGRDVWGAEALAQPGAPSLESVEHYLAPSFLADPVYQTPVPYLPLSHDPLDDSFALHVIDGSHIIAEGIRNWLIQGAVLPNGEEAELMHKPARVTGDEPRYFFAVGDGEVFGSQLDRLDQPTLLDGYLPILRLRYTDAGGVQWRRESFAARRAPGLPLTSWLRFTVTSDVPSRLTVRIDAELGELELRGNTVRVPAGVIMRSSHPLELDGSTVTVVVDPAGVHPVDLALSNAPDPGVEHSLTAQEYDEARAGTAQRWNDALDVPTAIEVPDRAVMDAMRNLLIQNLTMGHRYSIGNPYERTFLMEGHLSIQPLLWFGFTDRFRQQLLEIATLTNGAGPDWYESWERGSKLSAIAEYVRLTGDGSVLLERHEAHREYLESMTAMARKDPRGLLSPERYAWDIPEVIYGSHSQAVAWRGMVDILDAYRQIGHPFAQEFASPVAELGERLRESIRDAEVRLPDGSLFVPIPLAEGSEPFEFLPATREGNYWNLVFPYALTSGILSRDQQRDILSYMDGHGAFFLGLTRFSGLYEPIPEQGDISPDGTAGYKVAGIDNAFGIHHMRLLANLEEADRVGLCLYSKLAHGMTRGTFLDGESTTLGVVPGEYFRSSWYPPNSTSNALFLLTLRTILAHELYDDETRFERLALASSVPRHWLEPGKRIAVRRLPTAAGPVDVDIVSMLDHQDPRIEVEVALDPARPDVAVDLSLRAPAGWKATDIDGPDRTHVVLDGERLRFDSQHHMYRITVRYTRMH